MPTRNTIIKNVTFGRNMHISEGVLSAPVLIGGGVLAAVGTSIGLKRINYDRIMDVAVLSAAFFVASLIHVPLGPGSVHLVLNGLIGLVLGWASFPAIFTALLLQAVFFQYGGIVVLGVNTVTMALPALVCGILLRPWLTKKKYRYVACFSGGFLAVFLSALLMALALALSDSGFFDIAKIVIAANIPIMIIEGFVTLFVVSFLIRVQPEILQLEEKDM